MNQKVVQLRIRVHLGLFKDCRYRFLSSVITRRSRSSWESRDICVGAVDSIKGGAFLPTRTTGSQDHVATLSHMGSSHMGLSVVL